MFIESVPICSNIFFDKVFLNYVQYYIYFFYSEAMAVREAVLSQSPEFKNARVHAFDNATAVYDLLCISLGRRKQYKILIEVSMQLMLILT